MAQERNEQKTVQSVALQSLKNELGLAIKLLLQIKESRETVDMETRLIDSAREAYRHATEALKRMPLLAPDDMLTVHRLMERFRAALSDLDD